jgi:hypothetical protein
MSHIRGTAFLFGASADPVLILEILNGTAS